jgi:hypothetical protein
VVGIELDYAALLSFAMLSESSTCGFGQ